MIRFSLLIQLRYPGYRFVRWAVYADSDTPSNWNADLVDLTKNDTVTDGTFLNSASITKIAELRADANNKDASDAADLEDIKINAPDATIEGNLLNIQRKFGDITLVAIFEPAYSGLKIVKAVAGGTVDQQFIFEIEGTATYTADAAPTNLFGETADHLQLDILVQAIQAEPAAAVQSAWPSVTVGADGKLSLTGSGT